MKVILSRKGFDSSVGGHPSPILPDGRMVSLPIPSSLDDLDYSEVRLSNNTSYGDIISDLSINEKINDKGAHLDPDLIKRSRTRMPGWRPSFGQIGAAAGHLRNQKVMEGDLFLFYGWFRKTSSVGGQLKFHQGDDGFHAIYGYLQIGQVLKASGRTKLPKWLQDHPHADSRRMAKTSNVIYVASDYLGNASSLPGAGVFRFEDGLTLTKSGFSRSRWNLNPKLFRHLAISYHTEKSWQDGYFQSYPRAQEYVVHADDGVIQWAHALIKDAPRWC